MNKKRTLTLLLAFFSISLILAGCHSITKQTASKKANTTINKKMNLANKNKINFNKNNKIEKSNSVSTDSYVIPQNLNNLISETNKAKINSGLVQGVVMNWHKMLKSKGMAITVIEFYVNKSYELNDLKGKTIYILHEGGQISQGDLAAVHGTDNKEFDKPDKTDLNKMIFNENPENPIPQIGSTAVFGINKIPNSQFNDVEKAEYSKYGLDNVYAILAGPYTQWVENPKTKKYEYLNKLESKAADSYLERVNQIF